MSVAAANKFAALLNDDEDSKPVASKQTSKPSAQSDAKKNESKSTGPAARSGNYYPRGGGRGGKPQERDAAPAIPEDNANTGARFERTENRGERGGRGRGRGERGRGRGAARMDRHSRTDIVDSEKQVNQGWGADKAEALTEAQGEADAQAEADQTPAAAGDGPDWGEPPAADWGAPPEGGDAPAEGGGADSRPPRPVEEEDKTMTLEEFRASKSNTLADLVGETDTRVANEGKDLFKDAKKLNKADGNESYFAGQTKTKAAKTKEKKQKETIEIDGQFSEPPGGGFRGGRGRGEGRGGFRGGDRGGGDFRGGGRDRGERSDFRGGRGGRGGGGGGGGYGGRGGRGGYGGPNGNARGGAAVVDVEDQSAFPSL
ncbi:hypothetical protein FRB94_001532 [Tulasnella sp. JGI-2019a]|nr:hypothetical protein FRB94_001532 [Tulasnella sp. JGI-2019a]